jgi:YHS domain-containing protein
VIRLLFLLIVAYLAYRLIKDYVLPPGPAGSAPGEGADPVAKGEGEEMALDPVCGSYVPASSALRVRKGEEVIHFCGEECRQKFMAGLKE